MDMDAEVVDFGLCVMVGSQNLKRLREMVLEKLFVLTKGCSIDSKIENYIDLYLAEFEKEALRKCMVTNLYREGMSHKVNAEI